MVIASLASGVFHDLRNLRSLNLSETSLTKLNLTGAIFDSLGPCFNNLMDIDSMVGFCIDGDISELILDHAALSQNSFEIIMGGVLTNASLVGLTFSDGMPSNLDALWRISSLKDVRVDERLFARYADEFNASAAQPGHTVTVAGDLDGDRILTAADVDHWVEGLRAGNQDAPFDLTDDASVDLIDHVYWVHQLKQTFFGDANLDGEFNNADLVSVFQGGQYEDTVEDNSGWATGDWNVDGDFTSSDLIVALADGGYEQGPRLAVAANVPEPNGLAILVVGLRGLVGRRTVRVVP